MKEKFKKYKKSVLGALILSLLVAGGVLAIIFSQAKITANTIKVANGIQISKDGNNWSGNISGEEMTIYPNDTEGYSTIFHLRNMTNSDLPIHLSSKDVVNLTDAEGQTVDASFINAKVECPGMTYISSTDLNKLNFDGLDMGIIPANTTEECRLNFSTSQDANFTLPSELNSTPFNLVIETA